MTVDLSGLAFADSNSIQALVPAARTLQERGGDIILPSPQPMVARMLSLLGADQTIQVQLGVGTRPEPQAI
jgi:anti-anti-sigma factor